MSADSSDQQGWRRTMSALRPTESRSRGEGFLRYGHVVGLGVAGLGLLVIGLGWYGASGRGGQVNHQTTITAQLPYLLSGGAIGLALVIIGIGVLIVHSLRVTRDRTEALMIAIQNPTQSAVPADTGDLVVAGTASYHSLDCRLAPDRGRGDSDYLLPEEATKRGLRPCRMCRPPTAATTASA